MNKDTIGQRIRALRRSNKLTQAQLAKIAGVSSPAVTEWEKDSYSPKAASLEAMAHYFQVSIEYLLTGQGDKAAATREDSLGFNNVRLVNAPLRKIPLLDFVQAGAFLECGYDGINSLGDSYTTYENSRPECVFSLEVAGMSMSPDFMPGDKLVVDASKSPYPGCFVIAQNGSHEATFKKYRAVGYDEHGRETFELVPLNPDYPIMDSIKQEIRIIGVVVEHLRKF